MAQAMADSDVTLTKEQVLHVAKLARLKLSPDEVARMTEELSAIVAYVHKLSQLDTSNVPPTAQVRIAETPLRADEARPTLPHDEALREAPRATADGFAVPAFVED